ncbi:MAG: hypothetical protein EOO73_31605 [Myxococcales bacterium]|nr:MAG: hypothetical protein EOO73_31605 [Myxococcales bacterium]
MATQSNYELLENLRSMVRDMLKLRTDGGPYAKLARAHGYVDGYMRVLLEAGIADHKSLLALVAEERRKHDGPATTAVRASSLEEAGLDDAEDARIVAA